jgi:hypothetical protein
MVTARQSDELRVRFRKTGTSTQPFQQPCPKRIKFLYACHVDRDAFGIGDLRRGRVQKLLQQMGMRGRPCSGRRESQPVTRLRAVQKWCRGHRFLAAITWASARKYHLSASTLM